MILILMSFLDGLSNSSRHQQSTRLWTRRFLLTSLFFASGPNGANGSLGLEDRQKLFFRQNANIHVVLRTNIPLVVTLDTF
jgi:hypothetical protein